MSENFPFAFSPITGANFGHQIHTDKRLSCRSLIRQLEQDPEVLLRLLCDANGLLLLSGMEEITHEPELLVRLSRLCGPGVENYRETLTRANLIHPRIDEILVLGNRPPSSRKSPPPPDPPLTADQKLPIQFPHRRGWHTDQSFRRPPPDISLFYCVTACQRGQGQTLFADGIGAYAALTTDVKEKLAGLDGLHALLGTGRSETARRRGEPVQSLLPHQQSQRQPIVREHPVTGRKALYLCEDEQMDWLDGPIAGMQPGPGGDGGRLVYELMTHFTGSAFTYAHDWTDGDLIIYDNRCLIHSATWYDDTAHDRLMWRTTVSGNPGAEYAGENPSWISADGKPPLHGLD